MALPDIRSLLPVPNFPNTINPTQIVRPSQPLRIAFQAQSPQYALKSAHTRAVIPR
jgi:hypothetical protein